MGVVHCFNPRRVLSVCNYCFKTQLTHDGRGARGVVGILSRTQYALNAMPSSTIHPPEHLTTRASYHNDGSLPSLCRTFSSAILAPSWGTWSRAFRPPSDGGAAIGVSGWVGSVSQCRLACRPPCGWERTTPLCTCCQADGTCRLPLQTGAIALCVRVCEWVRVCVCVPVCLCAWVSMRVRVVEILSPVCD